MKILYILRSTSGSGKSTLAKTLSAFYVEADMFHYDSNGNYNFDVKNLGAAHKWCKDTVENHMKAGVEKVVVSNTSTREADVNVYRKLALKYGYTPFVMIVENWHNGTDIHNVPLVVKDKQKSQILNSIKL